MNDYPLLKAYRGVLQVAAVLAVIGSVVVWLRDLTYTDPITSNHPLVAFGWGFLVGGLLTALGLAAGASIITLLLDIRSEQVRAATANPDSPPPPDVPTSSTTDSSGSNEAASVMQRLRPADLLPTDRAFAPTELGIIDTETKNRVQRYLEEVDVRYFWTFDNQRHGHLHVDEQRREAVGLA